MKPFVVTGIDIETTGLKQEDGHRIIEICVSPYKTVDGLNFQKLKPYVKRINPMRSIDAKAQAVHKISLPMLKSEPEWKEVAPLTQKLMAASDLLVIHNAEFDIPFIGGELDRVGLKIPPTETFCTMVSGRCTTAMGKVPNLGELCFALDVDYDPDAAHSALYDVDCMMMAFITGVNRGVFTIEGYIAHEEAA